MTDGLFLGQLLVCIGVLAILFGFIVVQRGREPRLDMILCATALLMGSISLHFVSWGYAHGGPIAQVPIINGCELMFASGATVLVAASLFLDGVSWTRSTGMLPVIFTLIPPAVALPYAVVTGQAGALLSALTLSLLLSYLISIHKDDERHVEIEHEAHQQQALLLQEQMHTHFVLGVLDTLHDLCESDPAAAATGTEELVEYLSTSRERLSSDELIPFEEELGRIRQYVELERLDPQSQLEMTYDLQTSDFSVPALSIEPLVECAVQQVLCSSDANRSVHLSTELHGEVVKIVVEGSGADIHPTDEQTQLAGRIIENVRKRLATTCHATINVTSSEAGARTVVLLPTEHQA